MNNDDLIKVVTPIVQDVVDLEKKVEELERLPGPVGEEGKAGEPGAKGEVGEVGEVGVPGEPGKSVELDAVVEKLANDHGELLEGRPGKDADPEEVALMLIENFIDQLKGEPGKDGEVLEVSVDDVAAALKSDIDFLFVVKGDDGKPGEDAKVDYDQMVELIKANPAFLKSIVGEKGDSVSVKDVTESLAENEQFLKETKGEKGNEGQAGVGAVTEGWKEGVYREKDIVTHFMGRYYRAVNDTADEPGKSADWERIGSAGFRNCGIKETDREYEDGDFYIDGGTTFLYWKGKGRMMAQRGAKGAKGASGSDGKDGLHAPIIVAVTANMKGLAMAMDDGTVNEVEIEGLAKFLDDMIEAKALGFIDQQRTDEEKIGIPTRIYRGNYKRTESYNIGDLINMNKALYICLKKPPRGETSDKYWIKMAGSGGGGGGGAGAWSNTAASTLYMNHHLIVDIANPRGGNIGKNDAVNRHTMETAIASSSLYQGLTLPSLGCPEVITATDSGFVRPVADEVIAKPVATLPDPATGHVAVWFHVSGLFEGFTADPASTINFATPYTVEFILDDQSHHEHTFAIGDWTLDEVNNKVGPPMGPIHPPLGLNAFDGSTYGGNVGPVVLHMLDDGAGGVTPWIVVETLLLAGETEIDYPIFWFGMVGGGFPPFEQDQGTPATTPPAPPAKDNSPVGHTWNWIIETRNPEVPEYAPPGIPGLAVGTLVDNGDRLQWNAHQRPDPTLPLDPKKFIGGMDLIRGASLTKHSADQMYWEVDGSSMYWKDRVYKLGSIVYNSEMLWLALRAIPFGSPEPGTVGTGAETFWRRVSNNNNLVRALVAPTVPPPRVGDMWMNISPVNGVANEILQIWNGLRWTHPNNMPSISRGETLPATPSNGDLHYVQGGAESNPRIRMRNGGTWQNFGTDVQIHETEGEVSGEDRNVVALQMGTIAEPHPIIWMRNESGVAAEQGWKQVNRLWNSAWGFIGMGSIAQSVNAGVSVNLGNVAITVQRGRRYKVTGTVSCGITGSTAVVHCHAHMNVAGSWVGGGEGGLTWNGTGMPDNVEMGTIALLGMHDTTTSGADTAFIQFIPTHQMRILGGHIMIEDIGPTVRPT